MSLVKAGYGSLEYLEQLDTDDLLDIFEYESICADITHYQYEQAQR